MKKLKRESIENRSRDSILVVHYSALNGETSIPTNCIVPKAGVPGRIVTIAWHFKPRGLGLTGTSPVFLPRPTLLPHTLADSLIPYFFLC